MITIQMIEMLRLQAIEPYLFDMDRARQVSSDPYYIAFLTEMSDKGIREEIRDIAYEIRNASRLKIPMIKAIEIIYLAFVNTFNKTLDEKTIETIKMSVI